MPKSAVIEETPDLMRSHGPGQLHTHRPSEQQTDPDSFLVRPITASLGVNTAWQQEADQPLELPSFQGVQQITQMALMFTLWSRVEDYLHGDCEVVPLTAKRDEKKNLAILRESESSIICLLCLLNNEPYTAGGLVDAMIGQAATVDQRGNARKRLINRTLPVIADRYGLLQYRENNKGNLREYSIGRSARLAEFAESYLASGVEQIVNSEFTRPDDHDAGVVQKNYQSSPHAGSRT